jgi:hypothetical protein
MSDYRSLKELKFIMDAAKVKGNIRISAAIAAVKSAAAGRAPIFIRNRGSSGA